MSDKYLNSTGIATIRDWVKSLIKNNFSKVSANGTNVAASNSDDTLTLSPGSNVQISGDATTKIITISATDTKYSNATTQAAGLMSSSDKNKLDHVNVNANDGYDEIQVDEGVPGWTSLTNTNGILQLERGANIQLTVVPTAPVPRVNISATDTTYSNASTSADGLMSAADKTKLNGVEDGAEENQDAFSSLSFTTNSTGLNYETISADQKTDGLLLIIKTGSSNSHRINPDNGAAEFTIKDTTYSTASTSAAGLMSSSDKTKLDGIAAGAEVNVQADWNQTTTTHDAYIKNKPTNLNQFTNGPGYQTASEVQALIDTAVSATYKYKGSVASYSNLPSSGNTTGDVWNVEDTGMNYAWNGTAWDSLGGLVDLTGYWAKTELVAFTANEVTAILTA